MEPGLDDRQLTRLLGLELQNSSSGSEPEPRRSSPEPNPPVVAEPQRKISRDKNRGSSAPRRRGISIQELSPEDIAHRLEKQMRENQWHQFTENNLILKQGLVDKRKVSFISVLFSGNKSFQPIKFSINRTSVVCKVSIAILDHLSNFVFFCLQGLFARQRMLLLTQGPHLYYVDPVNMVLKGEIPWSQELRVEPKNFKIFFVHTVSGKLLMRMIMIG